MLCQATNQIFMSTPRRLASLFLCPTVRQELQNARETIVKAIACYKAASASQTGIQEFDVVLYELLKSSKKLELDKLDRMIEDSTSRFVVQSLKRGQQLSHLEEGNHALKNAQEVISVGFLRAHASSITDREIPSKMVNQQIE